MKEKQQIILPSYPPQILRPPRATFRAGKLRLTTATNVMRHIAAGAGAASARSGEGGKCGGGMGGRQAGGFKGGAKRKTHAGRK
jgi:hypothetical protein